MSSPSSGRAPCLAFDERADGTSSVTVTTTSGKVIGFQQPDGTSHFRGVPFAASTAGANRWKPPQPREPWEGELDCTSYGDAPFQPPDTGMNGMLGGAKYDGQDIGRMGDDCLNLNIVTPGTSGRLPVMVWIHGGANKQGSAKGDGCGMTPTHTSVWALAGVVVVSVAYRHGLHGFLHMPNQGITNLAIRDLLASLAWIQAEIGNFGGDEDRVTVFGESSGAVNICTLLSSPLAQNLFHRAIIQSGGPNEVCKADYDKYVLPDIKTVLSAPLKANGHILNDSTTDAEFLAAVQTLDGPQLAAATVQLKAIDSIKNKTGRLMNPPNFYAYVGDDVLPERHTELVASGVAAGKVVIIGHNSCEPSMFNLMLGRFAGPLLRWVMLAPLLRGALGLTLEDEQRLPAGCLKKGIAQLISGHQALIDAKAGSQMGTWFGSQETDGTMQAAQQIWQAAPPTTGAWVTAQAEHGPLFQYTLHLDPVDSPKGNFHGLDMALLFPPTDPAEREYVSRTIFNRSAFGAQVDAVSASMIQTWAQFASCGAEGLSFPMSGHPDVEWPQYPRRLTIGSSVEEGESQFSPDSEESKLWATVMAEAGIEPAQERAQAESSGRTGLWFAAISVAVVAIYWGAMR